MDTKIAFIENNYEKKGIFFQVPWYRSAHEFPWSMCYGNNNDFLSWYKKATRLIIPLIFNRTPIEIYKECLKQNGDRSCDGVMILRFRLPFTFSRNMRSLYCVFPEGSTIKSISSWGYEDSNCEVDGACSKEYTTIEFHDGSKKKIVKTGAFYYTYRHVIEQEFGNTVPSND